MKKYIYHIINHKKKKLDTLIETNIQHPEHCMVENNNGE